MITRNSFTAPNTSLFFIGLMLIVPFLFPNLPKPIPTFYKEWLAAVCALLAFIPLIKQSAWPSYQAPTIIWLPIAMLGVMAVQLAVLDIAYWQHYFLMAQYVVFAALLMLLGAMLKQAIGFERTMHGIAIALVVSGLLSVTIIALDLNNIYLNGWVLENKSGGAVANVGQQNHLSTLLALGLASIAFMFTKQRLSAWLAWPLLACLLAGLALSGSRSAWVFVALITLTALAYRHWQAKAPHTVQANPQRLRALLALPVLFYAVQVGLPHLPTAKPITTSNQRLVQLAQNQDSPRLQIYQAAWYVYADQPFLGTGFGQMAGYDIQHADRTPKLKDSIAHAHNLVLQFLAETGAVGTTVLLVCLLAFFLRSKSAPITPERWLWWLMLGIIGTHAMLEYPLWYLYYLGLASILLGLGDIQYHAIKRLHPQVLFTLITFLWTVSLVQTMHDYRIIQTWAFQNQKVKMNNERFDRMFQQLQPVRALSPMALYADNILIHTLPVDRDSLQDKLAITKRLLKAYVSPALAYNYCTLLALNGQLEDAKALLDKVYMRHPNAIDQYWQNTVKLTLKGEPMLFHLVKHIELLRDGYDPNYQAPTMEEMQFNQPALAPKPEAARG